MLHLLRPLVAWFRTLGRAGAAPPAVAPRERGRGRSGAPLPSAAGVPLPSSEGQGRSFGWWECWAAEGRACLRRGIHLVQHGKALQRHRARASLSALLFYRCAFPLCFCASTMGDWRAMLFLPPRTWASVFSLGCLFPHFDLFRCEVPERRPNRVSNPRLQRRGWPAGRPTSVVAGRALPPKYVPRPTVSWQGVRHEGMVVTADGGARRVGAGWGRRRRSLQVPQAFASQALQPWPVLRANRERRPPALSHQSLRWPPNPLCTVAVRGLLPRAVTHTEVL